METKPDKLAGWTFGKLQQAMLLVSFPDLEPRAELELKTPGGASLSAYLNGAVEADYSIEVNQQAMLLVVGCR